MTKYFEEPAFPEFGLFSMSKLTTRGQVRELQKHLVTDNLSVRKAERLSKEKQCQISEQLKLC